jgi:hypothetical protein
MKNDDKTLGTLLARTLIALCMVTLSGCFTAFTPARDFCTGDPKDTAVRLCTPEEIKETTDWENR